MQNDEDYVIIWEAPELVPPEFRLYYDERGKVVCYTCEKLDGDYIIIDTQTYAEMRYDIRVIDGKIVPEYSTHYISRLHISDEGQLCSAEDISIVLDAKDKKKKINKQYWKLKTQSL